MDRSRTNNRNRPNERGRGRYAPILGRSRRFQNRSRSNSQNTDVLNRILERLDRLESRSRSRSQRRSGRTPERRPRARVHFSSDVQNRRDRRPTSASSSHTTTNTNYVHTANRDFKAIVQEAFRYAQISHHLDNWRSCPYSLSNSIDGFIADIGLPLSSSTLRQHLQTAADDFKSAIVAVATAHLNWARTTTLERLEDLDHADIQRARPIVERQLHRRLGRRLHLSSTRKALDEIMGTTTIGDHRGSPTSPSAPQLTSQIADPRTRREYVADGRRSSASSSAPQRTSPTADPIPRRERDIDGRISPTLSSAPLRTSPPADPLPRRECVDQRTRQTNVDTTAWRQTEALDSRASDSDGSSTPIPPSPPRVPSYHLMTSPTGPTLRDRKRGTPPVSEQAQQPTKTAVATAGRPLTTTKAQPSDAISTALSTDDEVEHVVLRGSVKTHFPQQRRKWRLTTTSGASTLVIADSNGSTWDHEDLPPDVHVDAFKGARLGDVAELLDAAPPELHNADRIVITVGFNDRATDHPDDVVLCMQRICDFASHGRIRMVFVEIPILPTLSPAGKEALQHLNRAAKDIFGSDFISIDQQRVVANKMDPMGAHYNADTAKYLLATVTEHFLQ